MQILFNLPDDLAHKLDEFCQSRNTSRSHLMRKMICKLLDVPLPENKKAGRPSGRKSQHLEP